MLSVAGYGKQRPISPNDTPEGKRLNRRIDLRFIMSPPIVTPQLEDIAGRGGMRGESKIIPGEHEWAENCPCAGSPS